MNTLSICMSNKSNSELSFKQLRISKATNKDFVNKIAKNESFKNIVSSLDNEGYDVYACTVGKGLLKLSAVTKNGAKIKHEEHLALLDPIKNKMPDFESMINKVNSFLNKKM